MPGSGIYVLWGTEDSTPAVGTRPRQPKHLLYLELDNGGVALPTVVQQAPGAWHNRGDKARSDALGARRRRTRLLIRPGPVQFEEPSKVGSAIVIVSIVTLVHRSTTRSIGTSWS